MATQMTLPRLGQGMESGTIVRWLKQEGDRVEKGEALYELDTEKVTQEVEAEAAGVLLKVLAQEGEEVEVGRAVAVIGDEGEEVEAEAPDTSAEKPAEAPDTSAEKPAEAPAREPEREEGREAAAEEAEEQPASAAAARADGRIKASPLARRIARERGIELREVRGTGPEGRIVAEDVERAAAQPARAPAAAVPAGEIEVEQLSSMRKTIARRLTEAWQAPVFMLTVSADMTRALVLHERLRERRREDDPKTTISDVITKVAASALMRHRDVNALFVDDRIELHPSANVGIAVAIPKGLVVPVIRSVERLSIAEIAAARGEVVERARSGKLRQDDLEGGTFSISNLGMYGIEHFTAVLNPPQVAIVAVGAVEERPVVEDGDLVIRPTMTMTLTCDHRAVDGATGAEFLQTLKTFVEEPGLAL